MWNWKNQGNGEKFYNMSQNWGNPTTRQLDINGDDDDNDDESNTQRPVDHVTSMLRPSV